MDTSMVATVALKILQDGNDALGGLELALIISALCVCMIVLVLFVKYAKCLQPPQQHEYDSLKPTGGNTAATEAVAVTTEDESEPDVDDDSDH
eukprot:CAMPEP_0197060914 /NCGR_PEP_ID=MMETSP1384-20130603/131816_1 /TAXON_ID=29189 /ORGANISM="Ammonia sp." /LENGTH=92 /DNA_ID=CAMNT_0042496379 /DNA_START=21 /DNA_END=296 /DNA_ORIENTATION=-